MMSTGAVVTGGDFQGLGVIRSLGRRGIPVQTVDHEISIACFSRFNRKFTLAPHPASGADYVRFLKDYSRSLTGDRWILFANNDTIMKLLAQNREELLTYYRIPTPDWNVIKYAYNKKNTYQLAESLNIPIPRTYGPRDAEDVEKLKLEYPVVLKPVTRDRFFEKLHRKAILIKNRDHLLQTYRRISQLMGASEVLIQDFIPSGPKHLYSFCPFFKAGKPVAKITARRARQHPMDFGQATTFAEAVEIPELEDYSTRFLAAIGYYGLAELEFMFDTRDGQFKFLEINARIWGWHTLARGVGLDLPYLLYQDMTGQVLTLPSTLQSTKWVRAITDLPTAALEILKGRMSAAEYLRSLKGRKQFAVLAADDPLPFIAEFLMAPYLWLKRGF